MDASRPEPSGGSPERRLRVLLVCSPGGHLAQMSALEPAWRDFEVAWATLEGADVRSLLAGQHVTLAHGPTNRHRLNLIRNLRVAWRVVSEFDPDAILSTGAGLAVPFFLVGWLLRRRCVYVESLTRTDSISLSGRLVAPFADAFFVQWPRAARLPHARFAGSVIG